MNRVPLSVVVLVVLSTTMAVTAVPVASAQQMTTVSVTVVNTDGDPVAGAELEATWDGGSTSDTTRSNGQALLDVEQGADITIEVTHDDYIRNHPYELSDAAGQDITVEVAEKATAAVTVTDSEGSVSDTRIRFYKNNQIAARGNTDASGEFSTGVIEAGEYRITVFKAGYFRQSVRRDVTGDTNIPIELETGTVSVTFHVVDENFDPPQDVANATISGPEIGSVRTQSNGRQQVIVPVNTEIPVTVEKDGYATVEGTISVEESDRSVTITTRKRDAITIGFLNDEVVVGQQVQVVLRDQYDNPVPEATVYLDGDSVGQTDRIGVLLVPIDSAGEHTIHAESGSLASAEHTIVGVRAVSPSPDDPGTPTDGSPSTPAPGRAGFVDFPGLPLLHVSSTGIGLIVGVVFTIVVGLFVRLRGARHR